MSVWSICVSDIPDRSPTTKPSASISEMDSATTPAVATPENDTPLARFLADPTPPSPLPASTPTEPKAMAVAKAKQQTPQKSIKKDPRYTRSDSPSPPSPKSKQRPDRVSTPTKPKKRSSGHKISPNLIVLPTRKRCGDHLSSSPTPKRQAKEHTPTPATRTRNDHWSPPSSRVSSPVRSATRVVPVLAAKSHVHLKSSRSTPSPEKSHTPPVHTTSSTNTSTEKKKYPSSLSVTVGKLDDEAAENKICYNCGKKGHWFMNCLGGCGKCEGKGHRTIDCKVIRPHISLGKRKGVKEMVKT